VENLVVTPSAQFWQGKRVVITGHTGFKGAWLTAWLLQRGAQICGISLAPGAPSLFDQLSLASDIDSHIGDIRTPGLVRAICSAFQPDVIFHLAAQSLVRRSYRDPLETWSTNVMGSAHVLDAATALDKTCAIVSVTTDKVYHNREWVHPYRETDRLGGHDPYSASKAANELLIESWRRSFLGDGRLRLASARAGNVIGGGDWAEDRITPDMMRAAASGAVLTLRNPHATRPWQHVLEPLSGYMTLAEHLLSPGGAQYCSAYNFGPDSNGRRSVAQLLAMANDLWPIRWETQQFNADAPHEATLLALTIDKAQSEFGWTPKWSVEEAVTHTVRWYRDVHHGESAAQITRAQIAAFEGLL
jgi:CDP-glucose 4,6-dehydratase